MDAKVQLAGLASVSETGPARQHVGVYFLTKPDASMALSISVNQCLPGTRPQLLQDAKIGKVSLATAAIHNYTTRNDVRAYCLPYYDQDQLFSELVPAAYKLINFLMRPSCLLQSLHEFYK